MVLSAQELRIGNLVWDDYSGEMIVFGIITGGINPRAELRKNEMLPAGSYHIDTLKPIPLTPEWLERFGFVRTDEHELGYFTDSKFDFYYDYHFKVFTLVCGVADVVDVSLNQIQFAHQLQNLFFSLTGKELTCKATTKD